MTHIFLDGLKYTDQTSMVSTVIFHELESTIHNHFSWGYHSVTAPASTVLHSPHPGLQVGAGLVPRAYFSELSCQHNSELK